MDEDSLKIDKGEARDKELAIDIKAEIEERKGVATTNNAKSIRFTLPLD